MSHLVGNGTHLYRRSSHLVRTPIVKTLSLAPDEMAYYDVAGSYNSNLPTAGFVADGENYTYVTAVGKLMRRNYACLAGTTHPGPQIWRKVTTSHQPEFIFYQGAWSTAAGNTRPEAFMKIPAYHFSIPTKYAQFTVTAATLSMQHGGTILQKMMTRNSGQYFAANAPTSLLASNSDWRQSWDISLGLHSSLSTDPCYMHSSAIDTAALDVNLTQGTLNRGGTYNARKIWDNTFVSYTDGYIPVTDTPWTQSISLSSSFAAALTTGMGGWIVPTIPVAVTSGTTDTYGSDYPYFTPGSANPGYWLCVSFWGFSLSVTLAID